MNTEKMCHYIKQTETHRNLINDTDTNIIELLGGYHLTHQIVSNILLIDNERIADWQWYNTMTIEGREFWRSVGVF